MGKIFRKRILDPAGTNVRSSLRAGQKINRILIFEITIAFYFILFHTPFVTASDVPVVQSGTAIMDRGIIYYQSGEYAKAILLFQKSMDRGADPGVATFNIGNCLYRMNKFAEAAAAFRKSLRQDPNRASALLNLASVLFRLGETGESIAAYSRYLRLEPNSVEARLFLAEAHLRSGDKVEAQRRLEQALILEPDDVSIYYQLAEIHVGFGEFEAAITLIRTAFENKPDEIDFHFYIGDLYRTMERLEEAAAAYRDGLALKVDTEVLYKLADVLYRDKKVFLAMEYLQKALAADEKFADAAIFLGNIAFDQKWWDRSEKAYLKAFQLGNREGLEGIRNLAYEYYTQGRAKLSLQLLQSALVIQPGNYKLIKEFEDYKEVLKSLQGSAETKRKQ